MGRLSAIILSSMVMASVGCGEPFVAGFGDGEGDGGQAGGPAGVGGSGIVSTTATTSTGGTPTSSAGGSGGGAGGDTGCESGALSCDGDWVVVCEAGVESYDTDCSQVGADCAAGSCEFGLVSLLRFEEQAGLVAADESPSSLTGQLIGSSWISAGAIGGGLDCSPAGRVELGDTLNSLDLPFSIAAWVKVEPSAAGSMTAVATDTGATTGYGGGWLTVNSDSGNTISIGFGDGGGGGPSNRHGKTSSTGLSPGIWYHVAGSFEASGQAAIYIDGQEVSGTYSGTAIEMASTSAPFAVCRGNWGGLESQFDGSIDEVRVYDRAINQADLFGI